MRVFQDMTQVEMLAQIEALRAENERLKAQGQSKLRLKVSEKGGLSVYGLGRFPVTLYRGQWERLAQAMPMVKDFIEANADSLTTKE